VLRWLVLALVVSTAHAAPRVVPFLPTPGIQLDGNALSATFCDASQRAIVRTNKNTLVSIDAKRTLREIAKLPAGTPAEPIVCDARDRIVIGGFRKLVTVVDGQVKTDTFPGQIRDIRALADGTLLILDGTGNVVHWDGTAPTTLWSTGRAPGSGTSLDDSGEKSLAVFAGRVEVTTKGAKVLGPSALFAIWLDDNSVLFSDQTGLVARWAIDAPSNEWTKVDLVASPFRFVRSTLYRAGKRFLVDRIDGVLRTISFDAKGVASVASIARMPPGRRVVAAGDAPFAVIAVADRAFFVDLTRPAMAIAPTLPSGTVESMAFSPDGRELAMFAGQDIIVAAIDRTAFRRLVPPTLIRGLLMWAGDGTLFVMNNLTQTRFNPDSTTEQRKIRAIGFTSAGNPVTVTRDQRLVIDRIHSEQSFAIPAGISPVKVDVTDRLVVIRSAQRIDVYALDAADDAPPIRRTRAASFMRDGALVGDTGILFVDDTNSLFLADDTGEHALGKLQGFPILAVAPDRKRVAVAIAMQESVAVYDDHGKLVDRFSSGVGPIRALAWSPNLHTLAVAGRDGVELWTVPR
jgi:hypothetical protein